MDFCFFDSRPIWRPWDADWACFSTTDVPSTRVYFARCHITRLVRLGVMNDDAERVPLGYTMEFELRTDSAIAVKDALAKRLVERNVHGDMYYLKPNCLNLDAVRAVAERVRVAVLNVK